MIDQQITADKTLVDKAEHLRSFITERDYEKIRVLLKIEGKKLLSPHDILEHAAKFIPIPLLCQIHADFDELAKGNDSQLQALGITWFNLNCFRESEISYQRAILIDPSRITALLGLADCLLIFGRMDEARNLLEASRSLEPLNAEILSKLGSVYLYQNEIEEALAAYQLAEDQGGPLSRKIGMHFIQALAYLPDVTGEDLKEAGQAWERTYAIPKPRPPLREIKERIRIGYYTPDCRDHSISFYLRPILQEHDRSNFEVFLYSDSRILDHISEELRGNAEHWRDIVKMSDEEVIDVMKKDELHLLVDLTGYFGEARPQIYASRPAPVQAHLIGYNNTTGLSSLDYRISDAICDPPSNDSQSSEKVIRLDSGFHSYQQEPGIDTEEGDAPCLSNSSIAFGCFNIAPKLNDEVLDTWASILNAVPASHLVLKFTAAEDRGGQERMIARFTARGIAADRIVLIPRTSNKIKHLMSYRRIDFMLDPFPVNGTTINFESLWMGVPFITLLGNRHSARVSASILTQIGLTEGITTTEEEYIQRAIKWSQDRPQIQKWRKTLRSRLLHSSAGQSKPYMQRLEHAYLRMLTF